jgi:SAM-dependent methyltransferase
MQMRSPDAWSYGSGTPDPFARDLVGLKARWLVARLPATQAPVVLDYGAGEGKHLRLVRRVRPAARLVGVDIRAPHGTPDFEFHRTDAHQPLPFATGTFDVVVSNDVLEHVADVDTALAEIARVLRPEGRFVGFVPLEGGPGTHAVLRRLDPRIFVDTKDHRHAYARGDLVARLERRFDIAALRYSYHLLGGTLDALFFASFKLPRIGPRLEGFWRSNENPFYRGRDAHGDARGGALGRLARAANALAYWEARALHRVPLTACGLHFDVRKRGGPE